LKLVFHHHGPSFYQHTPSMGEWQGCDCRLRYPEGQVGCWGRHRGSRSFLSSEAEATLEMVVLFSRKGNPGT
jgi:hypothetical protein